MNKEKRIKRKKTTEIHGGEAGGTEGREQGTRNKENKEQGIKRTKRKEKRGK